MKLILIFREQMSFQQLLLNEQTLLHKCTFSKEFPNSRSQNRKTEIPNEYGFLEGNVCVANKTA